MRRRSDAPRVRLADLPNDCYFDLVLPCDVPNSWATTYGDYIRVYERHRDELRGGMAARSVGEPFAELVKRFADTHGIEALAMATYDDISPPDPDEVPL